LSGKNRESGGSGKLKQKEVKKKTRERVKKMLGWNTQNEKNKRAHTKSKKRGKYSRGCAQKRVCVQGLPKLKTKTIWGNPKKREKHYEGRLRKIPKTDAKENIPRTGNKDPEIERGNTNPQ